MRSRTEKVLVNHKKSSEELFDDERLHLHATKLHVKRFTSSSTRYHSQYVQRLNQSHRSDYIHQTQEIGEWEIEDIEQTLYVKNEHDERKLFLRRRRSSFFLQCSFTAEFSHDVCVCAYDFTEIIKCRAAWNDTHPSKVQSAHDRRTDLEKKMTF